MEIKKMDRCYAQIAKIYFEKMNQIKQTGYATDETSYYCALEQLIEHTILISSFDVACVCQPKHKESQPDYVLCPRKCGNFSASDNNSSLFGVIEVTNPSEEVASPDDQTRGYLKKYDFVILTNYRDFSLFCRERKECLKRFSISPNDRDFWQDLMNSDSLASRLGADLIEFLKFSMKKMGVRKSESMDDIEQMRHMIDAVSLCFKPYVG